MEVISDSFWSAVAALADIGPQLVSAMAIFLVLLGAGHVLGEGASKLLRMGRGRNHSSRLLKRGIRAGFGLIGIVLGLQVLGLTAVATSILATGGLVAVILGFAFREIGENLLAGLFLGISRSFEVGDLIESSGHVGVVKEIDLRHVWIRSADGRDIFIPSAQIFRSVMTNYTRDGLRRADFVVGLDYGDDIAAAREALMEEVRRLPGVLEEPALAVRISEFAPQYCELKVLFWLNTESGAGLSEVRSAAMTACLIRLKDDGFTLSADVSTAIAISDPGAVRGG